MEKKTLVLFGYYDPESPRFWSVRRAMQARGWNTLECRTDRPGFFAKCSELTHQWKRLRANADGILVMFPGHYLVPLAWLLTRSPRKILMFDAFISLYDTSVGDRKTVSRFHPKAWMLWCLDWLSCHMADEVILDTEEHRKFFMEEFHMQKERTSVVYLEARADIFTKRDPKAVASPLHVMFYGSYIPLQGIEHILDAAALLEKTNTPVMFTLIGSGQTLKKMKQRAEELQLKTVMFTPSLPLRVLAQEMATADVCLGIFGTSGKASRVIPHKVYDAVAMGVPVITRDSPALREKFANHPLVIPIPAGDAQALAEAIRFRIG